MVHDTLLFGALLEVTIFQSHPHISPEVPVTKKLSVEIILSTC